MQGKTASPRAPKDRRATGEREGARLGNTRKRATRGRIVPLSGRSDLWARLGLRARVTLLFGLGALALSAIMGSLSYFTTRHVLVGDRESADLKQAYLNAALVRSSLLEDKSPAESVDATSGTSVLYSQAQHPGAWFSTSISVGQSQLPAELRHTVLAGQAATETFILRGASQLVVGVPIPSVQAAYFEVFDLSDLSHTLGVLAATLFVVGAITTLLGAAVGRSASSRTLRPLATVSRAAVAIAGGQLDTRLHADADDPDLVGLTSSFNRMVEQLQERIERETRFTSDVSHELRSPLTTLSASLEVMEASRNELPPRTQRALTLLAGDVRRFQRMVGDLLEISRSDTGSAELSMDEVNAGELVRQSVAAGQRSLGGEGERPVVEVSPDLAGTWLLIDKRRFERVIVNLLENAALYGGGAVRVTAEAGPTRDDGRSTMRVAVEDQGPGLAPSERARVFERFYRGSAAGRRGAGTGTGLGLALVAEHVRLHGGSTWAEEAEGGGARFVIELPTEGKV